MRVVCRRSGTRETDCCALQAASVLNARCFSLDVRLLISTSVRNVYVSGDTLTRAVTLLCSSANTGLHMCLAVSFKCGIDYHAPTDCDTIKKWLTKCADDSETANYISAHTKDVSVAAVFECERRSRLRSALLRRVVSGTCLHPAETAERIVFSGVRGWRLLRVRGTLY